MKKTVILAATCLLVALGSISLAFAKDDGGQSCIKRQMAKGLTACIAKAKCNGVTSRKQQAAMCP
jgi:hypothetical protein